MVTLKINLLLQHFGITKIIEFHTRLLKLENLTDLVIRRSDGTKWIIPSMQTQNVTFSYSFDIADNPARLRFAVRNLEDERAPLADETYGYYSKTHSDLGRNYYLRA